MMFKLSRYTDLFVSDFFFKKLTDFKQKTIGIYLSVLCTAWC